jgi:hypothetical protein
VKVKVEWTADKVKLVFRKRDVGCLKLVLSEASLDCSTVADFEPEGSISEAFHNSHARALKEILQALR